MDAWKKMQEKAVAFRNERDWKQFHDPKNMAMSLVREAAEVMEHFQWKSAGEVEKYVQTHRDEIAHELADVLMNVAIMAHDLGIDVPKAFDEKMLINESKYPVSKSKGNNTKYTKL